MASEKELTEYERRRLQNIKRNHEMMASLHIHSHHREMENSKKKKEKSYKQSTEKKKPSPESEDTPIVIRRRSLRARGMPPPLSPDLHIDLETPKPKPKPKPKSNYAFSSSSSTTASTESVSMKDAYQGDASESDRPLLELFSSFMSNPNPNPNDNLRNIPSIDLRIPSLKLQPQNIARLLPGKIPIVKFFPTDNITLLVAGGKYGHLAFWNVYPSTTPNHAEDAQDGIYLYQPHSAPVSGISLHPFFLSKMYTSCHDGILRSMDVEKEMFDFAYSSSSDSAIYSLMQQPNDANSVYFGEGKGDLNLLDARVGKVSSSWSMHEGRINSVDFSSANTNIMATSSSDGLACLWDVRKMDVEHPDCEPLQTVNHGRAVHSAYFSPSGSCLATTSLDDNVGVLRGVNFEDKLMIRHDNWTNRWISSFRAIWGWDDTHLYVGNMKRRVDVLSVTQRKTVYALESGLMSAIPCRYDAHPCRVGMLAGATSGGQVYIWTTSSSSTS